MRKLGSFISIVGVLALLAGLLANFVVVPRAKRLPADLSSNITYDGTLGLALNAEAVASLDIPNLFLRDVPITVNRQVTVEETDGSKALVRSKADLLDPTGGVIQQTDSWYPVDRKTMEAIENFTDINPDPRSRTGLVTGFPIGTQKTDYTGWNGEAEVTTQLEFVGEVEREGNDVYHFTVVNPAAKIVEPDASALPPVLPKAQLIGLATVLGLPAETSTQLAGALELAPDPVPITYTFASNSDFYVDPGTGILIDYNTTESRTAGIEIAGAFQPLADVWQLSFEQSDASIATAKADADEANGQLFWLGTILPWALMIGGALVALFGLRIRMKNKPTPTLEDEAKDLLQSADDLKAKADSVQDSASNAGDIVDDLKDRF